MILPDHSRGHTVHPDVVYSGLGGQSFGEAEQGGLTDRVRSEGGNSLVSSDGADEDCGASASSLGQCSLGVSVLAVIGLGLTFIKGTQSLNRRKAIFTLISNI